MPPEAGEGSFDARLERAADVKIERRDRTTPRLRRDPQLIVDLILGTLG